MSRARSQAVLAILAIAPAIALSTARPSAEANASAFARAAIVAAVHRPPESINTEKPENLKAETCGTRMDYNGNSIGTIVYLA
jgi:hypothetical protein